MKPDKIEVETVYNHNRYGDVLVTGIAKMYDEWCVHGPTDDIESGNVLVFFYDDYDGYGGMNPMPLSEPVDEFAKEVEYRKAHEYVEDE